MAEQVSGGFVILSGGRFWSGTEWIADPHAAQLFSPVEHADAWAACRSACDEVGRNQAVYCVPCHVAGAKVSGG